MKKYPFTFLFVCCCAGLLGACRTVRLQGPEVPPVETKPRLQQVKQAFSVKNISSNSLPAVLGGLVKSDNWIIYKDKQQEEFTGHVSYENDTYTFRADYALSDRARHTFSARGQVFLRQQNQDGSFYEAYAHKVRYNYQTQKADMSGKKNAPVKLVYHTSKGQTLTATAQKASFDLNQKIYILQKDVHIQRPTGQDLQTLTAQKATLKQIEQYVLLEGNATVADGQRTLRAETIIYDGQNNTSYAQGNRVLASGRTEQGTFAIIADKVQSDNAGNKIHLNGQVQGWLVSPQINSSKINNKF